MVDGQAAVIGAALAVSHFCGILQGIDLLDREHSCLLTLVAVSGDQRGSECPHDAGDIRTNGLAVRNPLEAAQHGIVVEGSSLNNDMSAKLFRIGNLDNLI